MNNLKLKAALMVVGALTVCGCKSVRQGPTVQAWEYKRVTHSGQLSVDELQKLGSDGWILSGYSVTEVMSGPWVDAIFRRPVRR